MKPFDFKSCRSKLEDHYQKTASSKSGKIEIFAKGLTHGFGLKLAIFPSFVFRQYKPGKCVLRYCRTKKRLSRL